MADVIDKNVYVPTTQCLIVALETRQHRAIREILLGNTDSIKILKDLEDQIVALRKLIVKG